MIINKIYSGDKDVVAVYKDSQRIMRFNNGLELFDCDITHGSLHVVMKNGVLTINGSTGSSTDFLIRFTHSLLSGVSNTIIADKSYVLIPANVYSHIDIKVVGGTVKTSNSSSDPCNFVLRDSGNNAAVNLKYGNTGVTSINAYCSKYLSLFCIYLGRGGSFNNLRVIPEISWHD